MSSDPYETHYYIAPDGKPYVADIIRDEHASNPEEEFEQHGQLILDRGQFPDWLTDAYERWVATGRDYIYIDAPQMLRYLSIYHRDLVRLAAVVDRDYDGEIRLDFNPTSGQRANGLFILTHDDVTAMSGGQKSWETDENLRQVMTVRASVYSAWVTGDTYGVEVKTFSEVGLGEPDESDGPVFGYYGLDDALSVLGDHGLPDGSREVSWAEYEAYVAAAERRRAEIDAVELDEATLAAAAAHEARVAEALAENARRRRREAAGLSWTTPAS